MTHSASANEIGFWCPDGTKVGSSLFRPAFEAAMKGDDEALASLRATFCGGTAAFDQFVQGMRVLRAGDFAAAAGAFDQIVADAWRIVAPILRSLALARAGDFVEALAVANRAMDVALATSASANPDRPGDLALVTEMLGRLAEIDRCSPAQPATIAIAPPFRYLISYPRSGSTMLRRFFWYAFSAPTYAVYPGDGRYFSRLHYDRRTSHPVIVKDHAWNEHYARDATLYLVRDGRDAMVSWARYQYAYGHHGCVGPGQLADFLTLCAESAGIGFWGDQVRDILRARARGADIRLIRYEELFGNFRAMMALAREIGAPDFIPTGDEAAYRAFLNDRAGDFALAPGWQENIPLPPDSYLPQRWSIGGGTIDWRAAFDARARRTFHDLGGTEMLIELGYETDPDWWREH